MIVGCTLPCAALGGCADVTQPRLSLVQLAGPGLRVITIDQDRPTNLGGGARVVTCMCFVVRRAARTLQLSLTGQLPLLNPGPCTISRALSLLYYHNQPVGPHQKYATTLTSAPSCPCQGLHYTSRKPRVISNL